ncbi:sigma-70 family RNA polymerase sigma factor [Microbacterium sp. ProA8]|uniref:RNA polymerase sigma factor n=1 Tax=Microbacterium chionoecetis TaxID=3153754 RepID=UPI003266CFA9
MTRSPVEEAISRAHHEEWARLVAGLARRFGDLDLAEDAAAEAFVAAVERWPRDGVPPNPGAWLTTTATRKAIDRLRRESHRDGKQQAAHMLSDDTPPEPTGPVEDDRLRLVFTCCHPALATEARIALTLRLLGGLTVAQIAHAFLVPETTMARRITRAKAKIKAAHIPYRVPSATDIQERLAGVLAVIYLIFNEGYLATAGDDPVRADLTDEAIRLGRLLRTLLPDEGEVTGLLALMLLTDARRTARVSRTGELVTLEEQDRSAWNQALVVEGHGLVRARIAAVAAGAAPPGRYQLLAAINAVHTNAPTSRDTDWSQIVALYDRLIRLDPSPIVRLNRAIAVAEVDGPDVALAEVDRLGEALAEYHAYHAARADLLRRVGRSEESRTAYDRAIRLAGNPAERAYLARRRDQLVG